MMNEKEKYFENIDSVGFNEIWVEAVCFMA